MKTSQKRDTKASDYDGKASGDDAKALGYEIVGNLTQEPEEGRSRWSTAFLMAGSALLGATAVAFWNRRTIAHMRAQLLSESAKPKSQGSTDEEIF